MAKKSLQQELSEGRDNHWGVSERGRKGFPARFLLRLDHNVARSTGEESDAPRGQMKMTWKLEREAPEVSLSLTLGQKFIAMEKGLCRKRGEVTGLGVSH